MRIRRVKKMRRNFSAAISKGIGQLSNSIIRKASRKDSRYKVGDGSTSGASSASRGQQIRASIVSGFKSFTSRPSTAKVTPLPVLEDRESHNAAEETPVQLINANPANEEAAEAKSSHETRPLLTDSSADVNDNIALDTTRRMTMNSDTFALPGAASITIDKASDDTASPSIITIARPNITASDGHGNENVLDMPKQTEVPGTSGIETPVQVPVTRPQRRRSTLGSLKTGAAGAFRRASAIMTEIAVPLQDLIDTIGEGADDFDNLSGSDEEEKAPKPEPKSTNKTAADLVRRNKVATEAKGKTDGLIQGSSLGLFPPDHPVRVFTTSIVSHTMFERFILMLIFTGGIFLALDEPGLDENGTLKKVC